MPEYIWIDTPPTLDDFIQHLHTQKVVAVDTESDSLYSYFEKVCLVQFTTASGDYILDPLAVDMSALAPFFASEDIEKVFHAAEYDVLSLKRDYGFQFNKLFDTMIAAKISGWPKFGLGDILEARFHVKNNKRFQQYNWGQRPLAPKALQYARLDTHYLLRLRTIQLQELKGKKRLQEAQAAFKRVARQISPPRVFDPDGFWRIKGAKSLSPQQQATLQALFILRDNCARKLDRPPFKVINNHIMVQLAQAQPKTPAALKSFKGIGNFFVNRCGTKTLNIFNTARPSPSRYTKKHSNHKISEAAICRYEYLRQWRNTLAQNRGVEPDVILSNDVLLRIAKANPATKSQLKKQNILGQWQFNTYAKILVEALGKTVNNE
ncbi:MAG TPA: ribonuclease D [Chloroflexi bacterium]|nr:MAG: hypothetical protein B6243_02355 [Anaerolineaceae bacterium 4572_5.2]HEY85415.1 ribonuclease D [Chloroflexota bacterium]